MAVPKRRKSSTRIKKGRGPKSWSFQQKVINQSLVKCASCQKTKIFHQICPHCLTYKKLTFAKKVDN
jgi:ribosomal protein L32